MLLAPGSRKIATSVAIIGAGPAGLMLAIELGCRGVPCAIFDKELDAPDYPKANATAARTMEHYRRRGLSERVRNLGLPAGHPQDVVYCTRLTGIELTRFLAPSSSQARSRSFLGDFGDWPSPELPHRVQQMYIEALLRAELKRYPAIDTFFGCTVESLNDGPDSVALTVRDGARPIDAQCAE